MIVNHLTFSFTHMKAALDVAESDENVVMFDAERGTFWLANNSNPDFIHIKVFRDPYTVMWIAAGFCPACRGLLDQDYWMNQIEEVRKCH